MPFAYGVYIKLIWFFLTDRKCYVTVARERIKLNPSKTQAVFFTKRRTRELPTSALSLDGCSIPCSDRAKYLGLILDKRLKFSPHFDYVLG
jgi:hypothetical protein